MAESIGEREAAGAENTDGQAKKKEFFMASITLAHTEPADFTLYDYTREAWVKARRYQRCGHPEEMRCDCYGRLHAGELAEVHTLANCQHMTHGVHVAADCHAAVEETGQCRSCPAGAECHKNASQFYPMAGERCRQAWLSDTGPHHHCLRPVGHEAPCTCTCGSCH